MWLLVYKPPKSFGSGERGDCSVSYYLLPGRKYSVGRQECDLTLQLDQTVSRKHAVLELQRNKQVSEREFSVRLIDTSTFGTMVNRTKLLQSERTLEEGDKIVFGGPRENFDACYIRWEPLVICFSHFIESTSKYKRLLVANGVSVLDKWEKDVTHLVISQIKTTSKVLLALSKCVPIVSLGWIEKLVDALSNFTPIPSPKSHLPELAEGCGVDDVTLFLTDNRRVELFEGKHFYFLNDSEFQRCRLPISFCSGSATLVDGSDTAFATFDRYLTSDSVVISGNVSQFAAGIGGVEFITNLKYRLEQSGRSMVSEIRIIHAIINVSNKDLFGDNSNIPGLPPPDPLVRSHYSSAVSTGTTQGTPGTHGTPSPIETHVKIEPDSKSIDMFCLFDENIDQFEYLGSSNPSSNIQSSGTEKLCIALSMYDNTDTKTQHKWEMECEGRHVPSVETTQTPFSSQLDPVAEAMIVAPYANLNQSEKIVLKKCFVKNHWPGADKNSYLKEPFRHRVVTSIEPIHSSSDEADVPDRSVSDPNNFLKRTPKKLRKSQLQSQSKIGSPTTPKSKRAITLQSPRSSKRSHLSSSIQIDSDSDNDGYLMVTPLSKYTS